MRWLLAGIVLLLLSACESPLHYRWAAENTITRVGTPATHRGDGIALRLNGSGEGVLELPIAQLPKQTISHFEFALDDATPGLVAELVWWLEVGRELSVVEFRRVTPLRFRASVRDATAWPPEVEAVALRFRGRPNEVVSLADLGARDLRALGPFIEAYRERWQPQPWTHASINAVILGRERPLGLYVNAWLGLGLLALLALCWWLPGLRQWRLAVALTAFAATWILGDAPWLSQLTARAEAARERFAGKSDAEKLAVSSDASLVALAERVRQALPDDARIYVATSRDLEGARVAYYLYPLNVYWLRHGPELPARDRLKASEYILVIEPSALTVAPEGNRLWLPDGNVVPVSRQLLSGPVSLLRVEEQSP